MSRKVYQQSYYLDNRKVLQKKSRDYYKKHRRDILIRQRTNYEENVAKHLLKDAKQRATEKGLPFDLMLSDITIPLRCPVLGIRLKIGKGKPGGIDSSPSLDRIIAKRGYVPGNIEVISFRANRLKSDATRDELTRVLAYMGGSIA